MKRLKELYQSEIIPKMKQQFGISNDLAVPRILKININVGIGKSKNNKEIINRIANDLYKITGQKPKVCKSKKSISGFKLTKGDVIGLSLTLRKNRMYQFLEKLLYVALPRIRDFRGLSTNSFDKNQNYSLGIRENIIFPEISYDKIENIYGMQITFNTNAQSAKEAYALFKYLGFPLKKEKGANNG